MIISAGDFPIDFMWGAATAAYQIEGAVNEEGRGKSIWDTFSHTPGKISHDDNGDIACDHYHRWQEDIAIMRQLHLNAYRFSISWPRILPHGRGSINQAGIDFYSRLIDHLLEAGITPFVTLYHWDLPQVLQDDGDGWLRRGLIDDFVQYTDIVSRALGDRVRYWTTFNEPCVFTWGGYVIGEDAPGWHRSPAAALRAIHHVLLAHGAATRVLRTNVPNGQVGIVLDLNVAEPASDSPEDIAAANRFDGFQNRWFLDPLFHGCYPADMLELYAEYMQAIQDGDMQQIRVPLDYLGVNCYRRSVIAHGTELPPVNYRRVSPPGEYTAMEWEVYPPALYDILKYVHERYNPPALYITENGAACRDVVSPAGYVHDEQRVRYLREHLIQAQRALAEGIPLAGYFVWSLLDNFEWAYGYDKRFGIVYVDYQTQHRLIKDSGYLLAEIIAGETTGQYTATD
jgi:beta-glucosidase